MANLPPSILRDYIVRDFEKAWNAMALADFDPGAGGNFMFARQAMVLLELASRVSCQDDALLEAFAVEIGRTGRGYLTSIRGAEANLPGGFKLPLAADREAKCQVLAILFDLVRNGHLHYGEQIDVVLGDGALLGVSLGGVRPGVTVDKLRHPPGLRPSEHLAFTRRLGGHLELWVSPGVLFVDIQDAADRAGVFAAHATLVPFERRWAATSAEVEQAVRETSHLLFEERDRPSRAAAPVPPSDS